MKWLIAIPAGFLLVLSACAGKDLDQGRSTGELSKDDPGKGDPNKGDPDPKGPPGCGDDVPACFSEMLGDPKTSCTAIETWKDAAMKACAAKKSELRNLEPIVFPYEMCGPNRYRAVKIECCAHAPPPPPPPQSCFGDWQGSPSSCKASSEWKIYAHEACTAKGAVLTEISTWDACGPDSFRNVKYACCSGPNDPVPPPKK
jgi:hypothetical protein